MVSELKSWKIAMFGLAAFMYGMVVWCVYQRYLDIEPPAAKKFRKAITGKTFDDGVIKGQGYHYAGTCSGVARDDHGKGDASCSAGPAVDRLCNPYLHTMFLLDTSKKLPTGVRRLGSAVNTSQLQFEDSRQLQESRQLLDSCVNYYVPWYLVSFSAGGESYTRCAYKMGTVKSSKTHDWAAVNQPPPVPLKIWDLNVEHRCIAGYADVAELTKFVEASGHTNHRLDPLIGIFIAIFVTTFVLCIRTMIKSEDVPKDDAGEVVGNE